MKHRDLHKLLASAGFQYREGHGRHRVWSKGAVQCVTSSDPHQEVRQRVLRDALAAIKESSNE